MKSSVCAALVAIMIGAIPAAAYAQNKPQHLANTGNTKVNTVKAKRWMADDGKSDGYSSIGNNSQVNFGSKKAGTCNMNVGSTAPGQTAPKEVIVTSQNIINICK